MGNPTEYTVKQLAETVQRMINPNVAIEFKVRSSLSSLLTRDPWLMRGHLVQPIPSDDPRKRKPDISKAKEHLNWEPTVPLEEGLKLTIDDFSRRLAARKTN